MNPNQSPKIVVVNDEPFFLDLVGMLLEKHFSEAIVLSYIKPEDAIAELAKFDPDLFITDTMMPKLNVVQILELLANRRVKYPIVVTSAGYPADEDLMRYAGPDLNVSVLSIPMTEEAFVEMVKGCLNSRVAPDGKC